MEHEYLYTHNILDIFFTDTYMHNIWSNYRIFGSPYMETVDLNPNPNLFLGSDIGPVLKIFFLKFGSCFFFFGSISELGPISISTQCYFFQVALKYGFASIYDQLPY